MYKKAIARVLVFFLEIEEALFETIDHVRIFMKSDVFSLS